MGLTQVETDREPPCRSICGEWVSEWLSERVSELLQNANKNNIICVPAHAHLIQHGSLALAPRLAWGQFLKHSGAASCTAPKKELEWHFFETILSTECKRQVQLAGGSLCKLQSPYDSGEYQYLVRWIECVHGGSLAECRL